MIAIDTNILIYAHRKDSEFHAAAAEAVRRHAVRNMPWGIPWPCLHEFLAIVTHPRIFKVPSPQEVAREQIEQWLASPTLRVLSEGEGYWEHLSECLERSQVKGPKVHDARIAALCAFHGVSTLWTADRDFSRFPIDTHNPL